MTYRGRRSAAAADEEEDSDSPSPPQSPPPSPPPVPPPSTTIGDVVLPKAKRAAPKKRAAPAAAAPETRDGAASCLISRDRGHTWEVGGNVSDSTRRTWLIENSVCESAPGELLMLFRSGEGCIFAAKSTDCGA